VAAHPDYRAARLDTGFIARHADDLMPAQQEERAGEHDIPLIAAALAVFNDERAKARAEARASGDPWSPWSEADAWLTNGEGRLDLRLRREGGGPVAVRIHPIGGDAARIELGESSVLASLEERDESRLTVDGVKRRLRVIVSGATLTVVGGPAIITYMRDDPLAPPQAETAGSERVTAPIPGRVTRVLVKPGDQVEKNAPLMAIEAMKMEMTFRAPRSGVVAEVRFAVDQMVQEGSELVVFAA
jgi:3-methylcrotonyl-CoA carboxylase alpha subunit